MVDAQADLMARMRNQDFSASLAGVMASQRSGTAPDRMNNIPPGQMLRVTRETARVKRSDVVERMNEVAMGVSGVQVAYPYHVSSDMATLVQWAASQLEGTDHFDRHLAPTGAGFARLDGGLRLKDVHGDTQVIHWLLWQPGQDATGEPCVAVWLFNDWNEPDDISQQIKPILTQADIQRFGRWSFIGMEICYQDQRMGPMEVRVSDALRAEYEAAGQDLADTAASTSIIRLVHAFWLLLNQTVTAVAAQPLPSSHAKRARRASLQPEVTVVKLRRVVYPESEGHEPGSVNWTKRWIVRGHWRWQPCGPGRSQRRRIWVNPFVKGPEDAPLSADTRVYGLHR